MKRQHMMWYAAALIAVGPVGLALGAPAATVLLALVVLACPVMMVFMMSGGHSHGTDHDATDTHDPRDTAGRT
jgi:Protein of unknown function (DUF2933)